MGGLDRIFSSPWSFHKVINHLFQKSSWHFDDYGLNMRSAKWKKSQTLKFWRQPGRNIVKLLCHGVAIADFLRKAFLRNITEVLAAFMKPLNVKPCVQLWDFSQAMQVQRIFKNKLQWLSIINEPASGFKVLQSTWPFRQITCHAVLMPIRQICWNKISKVR